MGLLTGKKNTESHTGKIFPFQEKVTKNGITEQKFLDNVLFSTFMFNLMKSITTYVHEMQTKKFDTKIHQIYHLEK